jgi:cell wall-associated NlpC family hydrolase
MVYLSSAAESMANYQSLIGRSWDYGKQDCYTIVRDYFALQGIALPDFDRPADLELTPSVYLREAEALGFVRVAFEQRQVGDVAIMKLGTAEPMHAAVFVEPWRILHQKRGAPSAVEWLRSYYVGSIAAVYRYAAGSSAR